MPKGAAIEEGQLRSGDQIVEVCTIFFQGFLWTSLKTLLKAGQMRARVSAPVQFLLSFGLKTLITLGDSHSLWTAVVYLNQVVFRTVLDRLFSSRLALAWELYGSFGICSYSKFWFCGLNERNGAWVRFIVPSSFIRQDLSGEVFSLCFSSNFFILELLLFLSNFDPCWHPEMTKAAWEFWRKRSLYKLSFIQRSRTFASL